MDDREKIRILKVGLDAALRWSHYGHEIRKHVDCHVPAGEGFTEEYIRDINAIRLALKVDKEAR